MPMTPAGFLDLSAVADLECPRMRSLRAADTAATLGLRARRTAVASRRNGVVRAFVAPGEGSYLRGLNNAEVLGFDNVMFG